MTFLPNSMSPRELVSEDALPPLPKAHRIIVFGGSFDPIHNGHLLVAESILSHDLGDEVMFVPARLQPHKLNGAVASAEDRLEMIRLATEGNPQFSYSDIELNRKDEPSYSFDTMSILTRVYPDCKVKLLIGMDSLKGLPDWYRAQELVAKFDFLIYPRPGILQPPLPELEAKFGLKNAYKLIQGILPEEEFSMSNVSATQIRQNARKFNGLKDAVPEKVAEYIRAHNIY